MNIFNSYFTPTTCLFLAIILGALLGKLNFHFETSAILIISICLGILIKLTFPFLYTDKFELTITNYSKLGIILFISVLGIKSGFDFKINNKKYLIYFFFGVLTTVNSFFCIFLILRVDSNIDKSSILGALCGSLTSSPGLSSITERSDILPEVSFSTYGISYVFGVTLVVFFIQAVLNSNSKKAINSSEIILTPTSKNFGLFLIGICYLLGNLIAILKINRISLGITSGILISGIVIGFVIKHMKHFKIIIPLDLDLYKDLGIILFLSGNGLLTGTKLITNINIKYTFYGIFLTIIMILFNYLIAKLIFKNKIIALALVAGSMTSTPGMCVLIRNGTLLDRNAYSLSYLGSLISFTIGIKFLLC